MGFVSFVKSKTFFKHLLLILASFLVLIFITSFLLKIYTRHGKEYSVPKITGLKLQDIENSEQLRHFELMVMDSVYKEGVEWGTVLTQDPSEGSLVKSGRKIYITVASQSGETVLMPNCKDKSIKAAVHSLIDAGLRVGTIMYRTGEINGIVTNQRYRGKEINSGSDIQYGERVDLIVEVHSTTQAVSMPDILSKTENDAEVLLWKAGLNTGRRTYQGKQEAGHMRVVSFSPNSQRLLIGSAVNLTLVNDSESAYNKQIEAFKKSDKDEEPLIEENDTDDVELPQNIE